MLQALSATVQAAANGFNETGPALDLTNPQVVQDIIYGARAWVSTTSDQSLPSSMANVDARTIYATAYATANLAAATSVAPNATEIEKTSFYTQSLVRPLPCCPELCMSADANVMHCACPAPVCGMLHAQPKPTTSHPSICMICRPAAPMMPL